MLTLTQTRHRRTQSVTPDDIISLYMYEIVGLSGLKPWDGGQPAAFDLGLLLPLLIGHASLAGEYYTSVCVGWGE